MIMPSDSQSVSEDSLESVSKSNSSTATVSTLIPSSSGPLRGTDKWLGGTLCPRTGNIYGIPGSSKYILKIITNTRQNCANLSGQYCRLLEKWPLRGLGQAEAKELKMRKKQQQEAQRLKNLLSLNKKLPQNLIQEEGAATNQSQSLSLADSESVPIVHSSLPSNKFKWLRGIFAPASNSIYAIPCNANSILKISIPDSMVENQDLDVDNEVVSLITEFDSDVTNSNALLGPWKWHGGCLSLSDHCIYTIPCNSPYVLKINTKNDKLSIHGSLSIQQQQQWYGGLESPINGCIYGIPNNADRVLKIIPTGVIKDSNLNHANDGDRVKLIGPSCKELLLECEGNTNRNTSQTVTQIQHQSKSKSNSNTLKDTVKSAQDSGQANSQPSDSPLCSEASESTTDSDSNNSSDNFNLNNNIQPLEFKYKWHGCVLDQIGNIYGVPSHCNSVLKIEPSGNTVTDPLSESHDRDTISLIPITDRITGKRTTGKRQSDNSHKYKYGGGCLGKDGNIYCFPSDADRVLKIDVKKGTAYCIGPILSGQNSWQNGHLDEKTGYIYAIPCDHWAILKIDSNDNIMKEDNHNNIQDNDSDSESDSEDSRVTLEPINKKISESGSSDENLSLNVNQREKWEGGAVGLDGKMYAVPQQADWALRIG